jgi:hypothetical protein
MLGMPQAIHSKPHTIHIADIPQEVNNYLSSRRSTRIGWLLMFLVLWDIVSGISGSGGLGAALLLLVTGVGHVNATWLWVLIGIQVLIAAISGGLIAASTWGVHLHYALRESAVWQMVSNRERDGIGTSSVPLQTTYTLTIEIFSLIFLWFALSPINLALPPLANALGMPQLIGRLFFLVIVVLSAWLLSAVLRKIFEDRSVFVAVTLFIIIYAGTRALLNHGAQPIYFGIEGNKIQNFQIFELLLLISILSLFIANSLSELSQSDCPIVDLSYNEAPAFNLSDGLSGYHRKASAFRVSLDRHRLILSAAQSFTGKTTYWTVYRRPYYLPITAQNFWIFDLSLFSQQLNEHPPFVHTTANGLYSVTVKLGSAPKQGALDAGPPFLENHTYTMVRDAILHVDQFVNTVGGVILSKVDELLQRRAAIDGLDGRDRLSIGRIRNELGTLRVAVIAELQRVLPQATDFLSSLSGAKLDRYQRDLIDILRTISERTGHLLDLFDLEQINRDVRGDLVIEDVIRQLADLPSGAATDTWENLKPRDEEFREKTADFLIAVLGIDKSGITVDFSEDMASARADAFAFQDSIAEEFKAARLEATGAGNQLLQVLLSDPGIARNLLRSARPQQAAQIQNSAQPEVQIQDSRPSQSPRIPTDMPRDDMTPSAEPAGQPPAARATEGESRRIRDD